MSSAQVKGRGDLQRAPAARWRCLLESVVVLAALFLPVLALSVLGDRVPAAIGQVAAFAILPFTVAVAWVLVRAAGEGLEELGLARPRRLGQTVLLGGLAGAGVLLVATVVITPLVTALFGGWLDPVMFDPLRGQLGALLVNVLVVSWLHAALCEEIVFRGFLLQRLERALGGTGSGLAIALVLQAALFGVAHYPQGLTGILATALGGLLWGGIFLGARRNLWVVILGHALMDTVLFVMVFFGWHRLLLPG
jgi:membrane protease YdiL (CAAX protease family)